MKRGGHPAGDDARRTPKQIALAQERCMEVAREIPRVPLGAGDREIALTLRWQATAKRLGETWQE